MSDEEAAPADGDVPAEVAAMDGISSPEEAHNADRPARPSGIQKHKKSEKSGTPIGELEIGSTVTATIKSIMSYGAFVDIGASTDALLHVSRLSDEFVSNVEDVVKAGDEVQVRIVSVDEGKGQIAVSMRSEEADKKDAQRREGGRKGGNRGQSGKDNKIAAALAEKGFDEEKFVEGEVVSTLAFGAFVRVDTSLLGEGLEGDMEGLVHISSLAKGRVDDVESVAKVGDKVQVRVKTVDAGAGRISLSMISKADEQPPRGERGQRPKKSQWRPDEMGAADWKESMEKFQADQPTFQNMPVIVDKRKKAPVA